MIWSSARFLLFAFLLTFFSSFGQTFFIGLFSQDLQAHIGLDYGSFGTVYALATLASAFIILWAGALIDRVRTGLYVAGVIGLYALGCVSLSQSHGILLLAVAIFLLRFSGQGLFSHIAITLTARTFDRTRGRALSISFLGHPCGEAILPPLFVFLGSMWPWQTLWLGNAVVLVCLLPLLLILLGRETGKPSSESGPAQPAQPEAGSTGMTRGQVIRDPMFHKLLPTLLTPGFVATGIFIHQSALVLEKGWSASWIAFSFSFFAAGQVIGNLIAGQLVDRFGARRLMPLYLLPMGLVTALACVIDHRFLALVLMAGTGLTTGSSSSISNSMWAESYGLRHLGAIRALSSSILVVSSALSPALFGYLLEGGITFAGILLGCTIWTALAALCAANAVKRSSGTSNITNPK
jgi:MFS family permease